MLNRLMQKVMGVALLLMAAHASADVREGLYFGVGIGDAIDSHHVHASNIITVKRHETRDHVVLNAFAGLGFTNCSGFYFAGEVGTYFPERSIQIERAGSSNLAFFAVDEIHVRDYVTGDGLLGFRPCSNFLYYLRGGVSYAHGHIHQFANTEPDPDVPPVDRIENGAAWRVGAGLNLGITCNFGIGLDYIFTGYPDVRFTSGAGTRVRSWIYSNYVALSGILSF